MSDSDQDVLAILRNLPMPPQSNNMYLNVPRVGRVPSKKLTVFKKAMVDWYHQNQLVTQNAARACEAVVSEGLVLEVNCYFFFNYKSIYTKDGRAKMMDVSNRIKALHDAISMIIQIDDRLFWNVSAEKIELELNEPESATCIIKRYTPRSYSGALS